MTANWQNRTLFHGDNLKFLRAMNSESVDLIATDPPFKKGRDFHATPDSLAAGASFQDRWSWESNVHGDWVDQLQDDHPAVWAVIDWSRLSYGDDMGAYLCFMAVRLLAMHRVLKPTGSIYLHCDPTASHYLKAVMDAVFGWRNFRNEIVWRRKGAHNSANRFGPVHDVLLFYSRSQQYKHRPVYTEYLKGHVKSYFTKRDNRGWYWTNSIHGSGKRRGISGQPWRGYNPTDFGRHWAVPGALVLAFGIDPKLPQHEKLDALYDLGLVDLPDSGLPTYRQYLADSPGQLLQDIWSYQPHTQGTLHGSKKGIDEAVRWLPERGSKERSGYPTQKPLGLYERIIKASSDKDDMVLDPFAGCATTCVAAERLGRQWVGMDIWEKAAEVVLERMNQEGLFLRGDANRIQDSERQYLFAQDFTFTDQLPIRTDDGETASPFLRVKVGVTEPEGPRWTRKQMYEHLLEQYGSQCQGCNRIFDDPRYLELDHNTPRADGGLNHISNRILLCGPCNRLKSHRLTLSGLREENRKRGHMKEMP